MSLIIQKFGGTSVGSHERMAHVARLVSETLAAGHQVVVVVSAMSGETDRLIQLAKAWGVEAPREYDALIATGEQVSAALVSMALIALGHKAASFTGSQVRILTTDEHTRARIVNIDPVVLRDALAQGITPVVAGFQGVAETGDVTTLSRGGSDLTAVALAAALRADECQIFTDVDGVYTSDPRIVPSARRLTRVEMAEMLEMASLGAKVLQNRCLEFAEKYQVPVRVLSSFGSDGGTRIDFEEKPPQEPAISGVTCDRNQAMMTVQGALARPGLASYIVGPLADVGIEVDMFVQNLPNDQGRVDISFAILRTDYVKGLRVLQGLAAELQAVAVKGQECVAKLSIVGVGMRSHAQVASHMFSALGREGVEVHLMTASEIKISVIVDEPLIEMGARALHEAFQLHLSS